MSELRTGGAGVSPPNIVRPHLELDATAPPSTRQASAFPQLDSIRQASKAQYVKLQGMRNTLDAARAELEQLLKLSDTVQPEDVIKGAGRLVGSGIGAQQMASLLATMPPGGGSALQGWLQQQAAGLAQQEAQIQPALAGARHSMGQAALHLLMAHHAARQSANASGPLRPIGGPAIIEPAGGVSPQEMEGA